MLQLEILGERALPPNAVGRCRTFAPAHRSRHLNASSRVLAGHCYDAAGRTAPALRRLLGSRRLVLACTCPARVDVCCYLNCATAARPEPRTCRDKLCQLPQFWTAPRLRASASHVTQCFTPYFHPPRGDSQLLWRPPSGASSSSRSPKLHLSPPPEVPPLSNSHSRDYFRVDLRPHAMQQNRHQVVSLITATPLFAPFGAREECVYTWTSGLPSRDMIAPSSARPPAADQSRNRSSGTPPASITCPDHDTKPGPPPGPGSHPGLTSHVTPSSANT